MDLGYNKDQRNVDKVVADQSENQKALYLLLLSINVMPDGRYRLFCGIGKNSDYTFPGGTDVGYVYLQGSENELRTVPDISSMWMYKVKVLQHTNLAHEKIIRAQTGELVPFQDFAGRELGDKDDQPKGAKSWVSKIVSKKKQSEPEQIVAKDEDLIQSLVDSRNAYIEERKLSAPKSYPDPKTPAGNLYKHKVKFTPLQSIKRDVEEIKHGLKDIGPAGIQRRYGEARKFYQSFPGGSIEDDKINVKDRNGNVVVAQSKVSMKSFWTSAEFRNASWDRIQAKGRRFSPLLKEAPSSMIKPIKTWIKGIGDLETLAISSLMAIVSIITLGDFNPTDEQD